MKLFKGIFLAAILLLALTACSNDTATNESTDNKTNVQASETKEKKKESSVDITGYWKDKFGSYCTITKNDDTYSLNTLGGLELHLKPSKVEGNTIITTIAETTNTEHLTISEEEISDYLSPGKEVKFDLSDNNNKLNFNLLGEDVTLSKVDNSNKVDPVDLVGNWMDDNNYITITKDNNVLTFSFEDGVDEGEVQFDISAEITDVIENTVIGKVTKFLPEKYANTDDDLSLGSYAEFELSDNKTKLSLMGDSELTKTDMSFDEYKSQHNNNE